MSRRYRDDYQYMLENCFNGDGGVTLTLSVWTRNVNEMLRSERQNDSRDVKKGHRRCMMAYYKAFHREGAAFYVRNLGNPVGLAVFARFNIHGVDGLALPYLVMWGTSASANEVGMYLNDRKHFY